MRGFWQGTRANTCDCSGITSTLLGITVSLQDEGCPVLACYIFQPAAQDEHTDTSPIRRFPRSVLQLHLSGVKKTMSSRPQDFPHRLIGIRRTQNLTWLNSGSLNFYQHLTESRGSPPARPQDPLRAGSKTLPSRVDSGAPGGVEMVTSAALSAYLAR